MATTSSQFVLTLICLFAFAKAVKFHDCEGDAGELKSISVSDCLESSDTCPFKVGTNVTLDVNFISKVDSDIAKIQIFGKLGRFPVPFPIKPDNGCEWGLNCPLVQGSANNMKISLPILAKYPPVKVTVRLELLDSSGKKFFCQEFPAQIDNGRG